MTRLTIELKSALASAGLVLGLATGASGCALQIIGPDLLNGGSLQQSEVFAHGFVSVGSTEWEIVYANPWSMARTPSGMIYALGAVPGTSTVRAFNGSTWSALPSMPLILSSGAVTTDSANRLYVAGLQNVPWAGPTAAPLTVAEWDGSSWNTLHTEPAPTPSPMPGQKEASLVHGVAASSPSQVYVAGSQYDASNVQHWMLWSWDGTSWSASEDFQLSGTQAAQAMAVILDQSGYPVVGGYAYDASNQVHWLVRRWDGSSWSTSDDFVYDIGNPSSPSAMVMDSGGNIYVTGYGYDASWQSHWITRKWDGSSWSTMDDYCPANANNQGISVALDSHGYPVVLGSDSIGSWQIRQWNGSSWTMPASGISGTGAALVGDGADHFWALGRGSGGLGYPEYGFDWTTLELSGGAWSLSEKYTPTYGQYLAPYSVVRGGPSNDLYIGGRHLDASGHDNWTGWSWDGSSFSIVDSWVQVLHSESAIDFGGTVTPAGDIYEVGFDGILGSWVVRYWNQTSWSVIDSGYQLASGHAAYVVKATSDDLGNAYVAGIAADSSNVNHVILRKWNGSAWSAFDDFKLSNTPSLSLGVQGLLAVSSTEIYWTGTLSDGTASHWIVRKWDGSSWSTIDDYQEAVSKPSNPVALTRVVNGDIYVLGAATLADNSVKYVIRHWSGGTWTSQDVPNPGAATYAYLDLRVNSNGQIYVLGTQQVASHSAWLAKKWDGTAWSSLDAPSYSAGVTDFYGGLMDLDPQGHILVVGVTRDSVSYHLNIWQWYE